MGSHHSVDYLQLVRAKMLFARLHEISISARITLCFLPVKLLRYFYGLHNVKLNLV